MDESPGTKIKYELWQIYSICKNLADFQKLNQRFIITMQINMRHRKRSATSSYLAVSASGILYTYRE